MLRSPPPRQCRKRKGESTGQPSSEKHPAPMVLCTYLRDAGGCNSCFASREGQRESIQAGTVSAPTFFPATHPSSMPTAPCRWLCRGTCSLLPTLEYTHVDTQDWDSCTDQHPEAQQYDLLKPNALFRPKGIPAPLDSPQKCTITISNLRLTDSILSIRLPDATRLIPPE